MCGITGSVITLVVGAVLVVATSLIGYVWVPEIVKNVIVSEVALIDNTVQMDRFEVVPFAMNFTVRIFNISNTEAVMTGGVPVVDEVGPYIYKLYQTREVLETTDSTIKYQRHEHFVFDTALSYPNKEEDLVTIINVPYHAIVQVAERLYPSLMSLLNMAMNEVFGEYNKPFVTLTAKELLFSGISLCLPSSSIVAGIACDIIRGIAQNARNIEIMADGSLRFSILDYKEQLPSEEYEVLRGTEDSADLGRILSYGESRYFNQWPNPPQGGMSVCNEINGTDSGIFAPFVDTSKSLYAINTDICRSVELRYELDSEYEGIPTARFAANEWLLDNNEECFCLNITTGLNREDGCLLKGAMELYTCVDREPRRRAAGGHTTYVKKSARAQGGQTHAAMYRVALLTCALLWLTGAGARIYERCELARELSALGVRPDHLSTWVCIAYHESRFDTNANNPYSGDHGIFQISQLYWCGPGKACGLPCSALHDDDITDDLDCAFIVHEEHTRLQGNGFLAWVVYPQHCKHNTKKYLVDCDLDSKNSVLLSKPRRLQYANSFDERNDTADRQNVEKLLPPYLSIGNVIRENYDKVIDENRGRFDWYNYKIDNIDELRLPVFNQPSQHISLPQTTSAPRTTTTTTTTTVAPRRTTTATTPYVPRLKVWRVIETNQFRKKKKFSETNAESATPKLEYTTELSRYTQSTRASTALELPSTRLYPLSTPTTPRVTTTTLRPTTKTTTTSIHNNLYAMDIQAIYFLNNIQAVFLTPNNKAMVQHNNHNDIKTDDNHHNKKTNNNYNNTKTDDNYNNTKTNYNHNNTKTDNNNYNNTKTDNNNHNNTKTNNYHDNTKTDYNHSGTEDNNNNLQNSNYNHN
ncbi:hypothetical protein PYW08_000226 [Mythimna loreyi]|uniref:Uncharacterized protein n=1 Tax=Mythimna loreyi TaxID=667449 RepID=A0ACC2RC04_9NEOP|nr:hypothetical protein PYW08_000226 [Mythimna loreyi]